MPNIFGYSFVQYLWKQIYWDIHSSKKLIFVPHWCVCFCYEGKPKFECISGNFFGWMLAVKWCKHSPTEDIFLQFIVISFYLSHQNSPFRQPSSNLYLKQSHNQTWNWIVGRHVRSGRLHGFWGKSGLKLYQELWRSVKFLIQEISRFFKSCNHTLTQLQKIFENLCKFWTK